MNIQNKPNIYTINNSAPPSYAEATGTGTSASETHNPQFDQRYPHMVVHSSPSAPFPYPHPPNCYLDRTPVQSGYPEYESAERQNQPTGVIYSGTLITGNKENESCSCIFQVIWIVAVLASIIAVLTIIIRTIR